MVRMIRPPTAKIAASTSPTRIGVIIGRRRTPRKLMCPRCSGPEAKLPTAQTVASPKVSG